MSVELNHKNALELAKVVVEEMEWDDIATWATRTLVEQYLFEYSQQDFEDEWVEFMVGDEENA